jgi:hypothetical protein
MKADGAAFIRMEEPLDFLSFRSGQIRCTNVEASYCSESAPPPGISGSGSSLDRRGVRRPNLDVLDDSAALIDANLSLKRRKPVQNQEARIGERDALYKSERTYPYFHR